MKCQLFFTTYSNSRLLRIILIERELHAISIEGKIKSHRV
jgi:hypothetical protein